LTYLIAKKLIKIPDIGLVNVVAGKRIVPEFVQSNCSAELIAHKISDYFSNESYRRKITGDLQNVRIKLGKNGASKKAAESVLGMLSDLRIDFK
jgi:lipid-A-disaccharide synthase